MWSLYSWHMLVASVQCNDQQMKRLHVEIQDEIRRHHQLFPLSGKGEKP